MFQVKTVSYEDREFSPDELITMQEAADVLGITVQGVASMVNRGALTEVINPKGHRQQGRRLLLRVEVNAIVGAR